MGLMQNAKHVPSTPNEPSADDTLVVNGRGSKSVLFVLLIAAVVAVGIGLAYRFSGGGASASASNAAKTESRAETPAEPVAAQPPAVCQGDLSQASEQRQWYCNGFMPWKQAVDAKLDRLDRRGADDGTPFGTWMLIAALGAGNALAWTILLRRRKTA